MSDTLGPYLLGYNDTPECGIYTGDAQELAQAIPDESVDLIFTDPVYDRIEDYEWLSREAMRVLKPNSAALVWCGIGWLPAETAALAQHLEYRWQLIEYRPNEARPRHAPNGRSTYSSLTWWNKGDFRPRRKTVDVRMQTVLPLSTGQVAPHFWGKSPRTTAYYLDAFTLPGAIVVDFFSGGGTVPVVCRQTSRRYLAFEIDAATADKARARVRATQPPLFVVDAPTQVGMAI